jgi:hypothetical protein
MGDAKQSLGLQLCSNGLLNLPICLQVDRSLFAIVSARIGILW